VKDYKKVERDTLDKKNKNEGTENKENEMETQNVWKVTAFCEAEDLDKLEKYILDEKD
jgi:hypothetical protein